MAEPTVVVPAAPASAEVTADPAAPEKAAVAEDGRNPFDVQAESEELAILEDLKKDGFTPPGTDIPSEEEKLSETIEILADDKKEDAVVEQPKIDEPAKEEIPPVIEAAPAAEDKDKKRTPQEWKIYRQANKDRKAAEALAARETVLRQEAEAKLAARRTDPAADPEYDPDAPIVDDPLTKVQKELKELNDRQKRIEAQAEADRLNREQRDDILKEEESFTKEHPDYREAMTHLVDTRKVEYETMGLIDHGANQWLIRNEDQVKRFAAEIGKNPEDDDQLYEAARDLAFRTLIYQDRQALITSCRSEKRSIAESVYKLAELRGFKPIAKPAAAAPAAAVEEADAARGRVQAAMRQQSATTSLSAIAPTKAIPESKQIKNRDDVLAMTEQEIDYLDRTNPGWDRNIDFT